MECDFAGFMHLRDVLDHYSDHIQPAPTLSYELASEHPGFQFTKSKKADIVAFMNLFTDSTFINNSHLPIRISVVRRVRINGFDKHYN